jgi:hypothetical protein
VSGVKDRLGAYTSAAESSESAKVRICIFMLLLLVSLFVAIVVFSFFTIFVLLSPSLIFTEHDGFAAARCYPQDQQRTEGKRELEQGNLAVIFCYCICLFFYY